MIETQPTGPSGSVAEYYWPAFVPDPLYDPGQFPEITDFEAHAFQQNLQNEAGINAVIRLAGNTSFSLLSDEMVVATNDYFLSCAQLLLSRHPSDNELDQAIWKLIQSAFPDNRSAYHDISHKSLFDLVKFNQSIIATATTFGRTIEASLSSGETEYALFKTLLGDSSQTEQNDQEITARPKGAWHILLLLASRPEDTTSIPERLLDRVKTGDFDTFLARDALSFVHNQPLHPAISNRGIAGLWNYTLNFGQEASELLPKAAQAVADWPRDARLELENIKQSLIKQSENEISYWLAESSTSGLLIPHNIQTVVEDNRVKVIQAYERCLQLRQKLGQVSLPANLETTSPSKQTPKWSATKALLGAAALKPPKSEATQEPRLRQLVVLKNARIIEDGEALQKLVTNFVGQKPLQQVVEKSLDYLSSLDFSHGLPAGVEPNTADHLRAEGKRYKTYRFKPYDVSTIPTPLDIEKRVRIIFALLDNGQIAIQEFLDRSQAQTKQKRRHALTTAS